MSLVVVCQLHGLVQILILSCLQYYLYVTSRQKLTSRDSNRGEKTAQAMEANLSSLEKKIDDLLATFDDKQLAQLEELEAATAKKTESTRGGANTEGEEKKDWATSMCWNEEVYRVREKSIRARAIVDVLIYHRVCSHASSKSSRRTTLPIMRELSFATSAHCISTWKTHNKSREL